MFWRRVSSAAASLMVPGLGQLANGEPRRAAALCASVLALAVLVFRGLLGDSPWLFGLATVAILSLVAWSAIDAFAGTKPASDPPLLFDRRWLLLLAAAVVAVAAQVGLEQIQTRKTFVHVGRSMVPATHPGERLLARVDGFSDSLPERGQLVLVQGEGGAGVTLHRVIGLAGEEVALRRGVVTIDGVPLSEPWLGEGARQSRVGDDPPLLVPDDAVFVLADARSVGRDSRHFGPVPRERLLGEPLFVFWSSDPGRIGRRLAPP